jgi:hypothetical protein
MAEGRKVNRLVSFTAQTLLSAVPSCVTPEDQADQRNAQQRLARALEAGATEKPRP